MSEHYSEPDIDNSDSLYVLDDEEDNLYAIAGESDGDDDDNEDSDTGLYTIEDEDEDEGKDNGGSDAVTEKPKENKTGGIFGLLLKIMTTPVEGWKELKRRRLKVDKVASSCFYPLTGIAAVSEFAPKIWGSAAELSGMVTQALITFMSLFFGYFTVLLLCGHLLPKAVRETMTKDIGKEFVMVNMSTLALFYTVYNLLPMISPVLVFLPIWTIYLVYKGVKILRVPKESENTTQLLLGILIIGTPVAWDWLCNWFLK